MYNRKHYFGWYFALLLIAPNWLYAQAPEKYALLVGVSNYEHSDFSSLAYPEIDATSMEALLLANGYKVDLLLGKKATQTAIRSALAKFKDRGANKGVVLVGVFGHGIEFADVKKSYYCPQNANVVAKRDLDGRLLYRDGNPQMEPERDSLVAIDELLVALRESKASNRVLIADCCRDDPNHARMFGRSFGSSLETNQLPANAAVFFACSENERAYEHKDWGHGAFTKCLLEQLSNGKSLMGSLAEEVAPAVEKLVEPKRSSGEPPQTPRLLVTGARIDLMLKAVNVKTSEESIESKAPKSNSMSSSPPKSYSARKKEGSIVGEIRDDNSLGLKLVWIPAGEFLMGSRNDPKISAENSSLNPFEEDPFGEDPQPDTLDPFSDLPVASSTASDPFVSDPRDDESSVRVNITKGYWLGQTEVTQAQWRKLMRTEPWKGKSRGKEGDEVAASYVSWYDCVEFLRMLNASETNNLPSGWHYELPTEAQWEFGCRSGSKADYCFGDDADGLSKHAWFNEDTIKYSTHEVARKLANEYGLYDMHGNVWEWCRDSYKDQLLGGSNPFVNEGLIRVLRGGSSNSAAGGCRSANRNKSSPISRYGNLGFRIVLVPDDK